MSIFTPKELKQFIRFVQSPYYNTNKILVELLEYCCQFAPNFSKNKLTVEKAFKHLYPAKKFDEQVINRLLSNLFKLGEEFIVVRKNEENQIKKNVQLLVFYREHQIVPFFDSWYKKLQNQNEKYPYRDHYFYSNQYIIEYQSSIRQSRNDNRDQQIDFEQPEQAFDIQYWTRKLLFLCSQLSRRAFVSNQSVNEKKIEQIIQYLDQSDLLKIPAILVWYRALVLLNKPDLNSNYEELKLQLENHHQNFDPETVLGFYTILINCVPIFYPSGKERYEEYFRLFEVQILNKYIYLHGFIHPHILKNIVTVALRLKKYDWTESFLKENKEKIKSQESYSWNLANLHYEQGEFESALDILLKNKYDDMFYQLGTKRMLSKLYYHLDYGELLFSFINTFRVFVSRKELNPIQKKRHQNFINFTLKLMKSIPGNTEELTQLLYKIETKEQVAEKNWLVEQTKIRMKQQR